MNKDYTDIMFKRTDEDLIKIVTIDRNKYETEAIVSAEKELEKRQIDSTKIQHVEKELSEVELNQNKVDNIIVSSWIRFVHLIVDLFAFFIAAFFFAIFADLFIPVNNPTIIKYISYGLFLFTYFLYFGFMEYKFQKTLGKFLTRTKVVMSDGRKPELNEILIRTACRFIPFDQISFLFTRKGFHDTLSNTVVIKDKT